jgi:RloB-like protein
MHEILWKAGVMAKHHKSITASRTKREEKKVILIICEGEKTEPNYFRSMRKHLRINAKVEIDGTGRNTLDLVNYASKKSGEDFDEIWCVFDKDDFSDEHFNNTVQKDGEGKICIAYSNECFELWYILHHNYHNTAHQRKHYFKQLGKLMGKVYEKNSSSMYQELHDKLSTAIRNAKRLFNEHQGKTPARANPSTTVHLLVLRLQEIAKEQEL